MSPGTRRGRPDGTTSEKTGPATDRNLAQDVSYSAGLDQAIANAASDWFTSGALLAIEQLAKARQGFTVDDVLDLTGMPSDPHYVGAAMALAQRRGVVEAVGCKVGRGGRMVRVWYRRAR